VGGRGCLELAALHSLTCVDVEGSSDMPHCYQAAGHTVGERQAVLFLQQPLIAQQAINTLNASMHVTAQGQWQAVAGMQPQEPNSCLRAE
jgi:hypothetical protein